MALCQHCKMVESPDDCITCPEMDRIQQRHDEGYDGPAPFIPKEPYIDYYGRICGSCEYLEYDLIGNYHPCMLPSPSGILRPLEKYRPIALACSGYQRDSFIFKNLHCLRDQEIFDLFRQSPDPMNEEDIVNFDRVAAEMSRRNIDYTKDILTYFK